MIQYVVLWIFFAHPWSLGPVQMTPGWYAAYSWIGDDRRECERAAGRAAVLKLKAVCQEDQPGPIAEPRRSE